MFSPYVVLAGPPNKAERVVARPSPTNVLLRPGLARKFLSVVALIAEISQICSIIVAIAIGTTAIIALTANLASGTLPNTISLP